MYPDVSIATFIHLMIEHVLIIIYVQYIDHRLLRLSKREYGLFKMTKEWYSMSLRRCRCELPVWPWNVLIIRWYTDIVAICSLMTCQGCSSCQATVSDADKHHPVTAYPLLCTLFFTDIYPDCFHKIFDTMLACSTACLTPSGSLDCEACSPCGDASWCYTPPQMFQI